METFPNIECLIKSDGQINIGYMRPVGCVAVANNEDGTLAMLKVKPKESLDNLLQRLDMAIEAALEYDEYIDEINN